MVNYMFDEKGGGTVLKILNNLLYSWKIDNGSTSRIGLSWKNIICMFSEQLKPPAEKTLEKLLE